MEKIIAKRSIFAMKKTTANCFSRMFSERKMIKKKKIFLNVYLNIKFHFFYISYFP